MLIRSQNKENFLNLEAIEHISIEPTARYNMSFEIIFRVREFEYLMGIYTTKKQALDVLDLIEKEYVRTLFNGFNSGITIPPKVFHMPEDKGL